MSYNVNVCFQPFNLLKLQVRSCIKMPRLLAVPLWIVEGASNYVIGDQTSK